MGRLWSPRFLRLCLITILHPCAVHQRTEETHGISGSIMLFHCGLFSLFVIYTLHAHGVSVSAHVCALRARNFLLHFTADNRLLMHLTRKN